MRLRSYAEIGRKIMKGGRNNRERGIGALENIAFTVKSSPRVEKLLVDGWFLGTITLKIRYVVR